jgi:hypothetical protein
MDVALAIVRSNSLVGRSYGSLRSGASETEKERAENLTRGCSGMFGDYEHGYVVEGDPYGWSEGALFTILMEPRTHGDDDCITLSMYGSWEAPSVHEVNLGSLPLFIEPVNGGVAAVHRI